MHKLKLIGGFMGLAIAMFMGTLDATIINIALPDITNYFHVGVDDASWISTIYVLVLSVTIITTAKLADQFGRKKVMLVGIVLFGGSSALCGLSHTLLFLIAMRGIQAIGGSILMPIAIPMSIELLGRERMTIASSLMGAITSLAAASGPPLGGVLLAVSTWQSVFFVNVPFAILALLLIALCTKESHDETVSRRVDWLGMLLLTAALFLLTFALLKGNDYGWGSLMIIAMFIGAGVAAVLFISVEMMVAAPMVELHLFREWTFTASAISYLIAGFGIIATSMMMSYFLQNLLNYRPLEAAYVIMTISLCVVVAMPLGSKVMGITGARPLVFLGIMLMGIGVLMLSHLRVDSSRFIMIVDLIVYGIGFGLDTLAIISAMTYLPEEKSGVASGVVNAARYIGTCLAIALLVSILDQSLAQERAIVRSDAIRLIDHAALSPEVKAVATRDTRQLFGTSDTTRQKELKKKLTRDLKRELTNNNNKLPQPQKGAVKQLYSGSTALQKGTLKVKKGQGRLSGGLAGVHSGLRRLANGARTLQTGAHALNSGLEQTATGAGVLASASRAGIPQFLAGTQQVTGGARQLATAADKGIPALVSGTQRLSNGSDQLLQQFSPGTSESSTVFDGVSQVAAGASGLSDELTSYKAALNAVLYTMIASDPNATQELTNDEAKLRATESSGVNSPEAEQQVALLTNLIALYRAGTDPSVTNASAFAAQLSGNNLVSGAEKLASGASQLATSSQRAAAQFNDGGAFKSGMQQLAAGTSALAQQSQALSGLQTGADQLAQGMTMLSKKSAALTQLQTGTEHIAQAAGRLSDGGKRLTAGTAHIQTGATALASGSGKLAEASAQLTAGSGKIHSGASRLTSGIDLSAQASEMKHVMKQIQSLTNDHFADAFDHNFRIGGWILLAVSPVGLFTDRRRKRAVTADETVLDANH
ncbi:MAG: MFS transporter [Sporolactobacillus sp.]